MSYILSVVYGFSLLVQIPLFSTVMERLRVAFPHVHIKIYRKANFGFGFYIFLLFIRYLIYLSL